MDWGVADDDDEGDDERVDRIGIVSTSPETVARM